MQNWELQELIQMVFQSITKKGKKQKDYEDDG